MMLIESIEFDYVRLLDRSIHRTFDCVRLAKYFCEFD